MYSTHAFVQSASIYYLRRVFLYENVCGCMHLCMRCEARQLPHSSLIAAHRASAAQLRRITAVRPFHWVCVCVCCVRRTFNRFHLCDNDIIWAAANGRIFIPNPTQNTHTHTNKRRRVDRFSMGLWNSHRDLVVMKNDSQFLFHTWKHRRTLNPRQTIITRWAPDTHSRSFLIWTSYICT